MNTSRNCIYLGYAINAVVTLALVPVTSNPFDFAAINGTAVSSLSFHTSLFLNWKFGANYALLNLLEACGGRVLGAFGFTLPAAMHISVKLLLVLASLLAAHSLKTLGDIVNSRSRSDLVLVWLIAPSVIWVSAGHAQIEAVAVATLFGSLALLSKCHWFWAGVVTGIGVGFEYFPLVVAGAVLVLWFQHRVNYRYVASFGTGLGVTLVACFAPLLKSATGLVSISSGLVGHATATQSQIDLKFGSIWALFGRYGLAGILVSHWYLVFAAISLLLIVVAIVSKCKYSEITAVGMILILATILDPTTLPQFSVIALAGALLIGLTSALPLSLVALFPIITYVSYFLTTSLYVFFQDTDPLVFSQLNSLFPWFPTNIGLSNVLATVAMDAGIVILILAFVQLVAKGKQTRWMNEHKWWEKIDRRIALAVSVICTLAILAYTTQPQLWGGVIGHKPSQLYDTPYLITQRRAVNFEMSTSKNYTNFKSVFDPQLLSAARSAGSLAQGAIDFTARPFLFQTNVGGRLLKPDISIPTIGSVVGNGVVSISSIEINLLATNKKWKTSQSLVAVRATSNFGLVRLLSSTYLAPSWAILSFSVSLTNGIKSGSVLYLRIQNPGVYLNSNPRENLPWIVASYESGWLRLVTTTGSNNIYFNRNPNIPSQSVATFPKDALFESSFKVYGLPLVALNVLSVDVAFSPTSKLSSTPTTGSQWIAGLIYLVLTSLAILATYFIALRRPRSNAEIILSNLDLESR